MANIKHLSVVGAFKVGELEGACMAYNFCFSQSEKVPQLFSVLDNDSNSYIVALGVDNKLYLTESSYIEAQNTHGYYDDGLSPLNMFEALNIDRMTDF
jgi:hypothetical protein